MKTLTKIFNYSSVPLYLLGEGLQRLAAGAKSCTSWEGLPNELCHDFFSRIGEEGINVYNMMPFGGQEMQFYFSGFFGAAGLNFVAGMYLPLVAKILPDEFCPDFFRKGKPEFTAVFSMAALTYWEMTHINTRFDWNDMAVYAVAVGLSYGLHKINQHTRPDALLAQKTLK